MKKWTIAAVSLATCATVGLLAACDSCNDKKGSTEDISLMKSWKGNENEDTYSFKNQANGDLTVKYSKSGQWQYATRTFVEPEENLALMKTLVMEGSMVTDTGDPMVTLKITYKGAIPEKEVHFNMSESKATYEWDLSGAQLDQALGLMLFAEGNRVSANGTITFNSFYLTANTINEANSIEKNKPSGEKAVNEITATNGALNGGWYDSGDGVYTVEKSANEYGVEYSKKSFEYANVQAIVKGDAIKNYKTLRVTVKGTAGENFRINFYDGEKQQNHESEIVTLTGGDDVIILDLTTFIADFNCSIEQKVFVMAQPGVKDVKGTFTIKNAEFSMEDAPVTEGPFLNTITSANRAVKGWYSGDAGVFNVTENDDGSFDVTKKAGGGWAQLKANVTGAELANMASFKITLSGVEGKKVIVKPYDRVEVKAEPAETDEITFTVDLTGVTGVDFNATLPILIFFDMDNTEDSSFTIESAEFNYKLNEITATDKTVSGWHNNGGSAYTVTENTNGTVDVTKKAGGGWDTLRVDVTGAELANMASFKITLSGVKDKNVIVKPFDKVESKLEPATQDEVTITVDLTQVKDVDFNTVLPVLIFFDWDNETDVSFKIVSAEFVAAQ